MNEKANNILKILGIWFGTILIITSLWWCFIAKTDFGSVWEIFQVLIFSSLGFFIVFSPAILLLYFLFKKVQNKYWRIFWVAFLIPFTNLIYLFVEHFCFNNDFNSYVIGFCALFVAIPTFLSTALFIPKSVLSIKWDIVKTVIIMAIFGIGLIMLSEIVIPSLDDINAKNKLEKYELIINNLENYKKQNGIYPQKIEDSVQIFEQFHYNTKNADSDYILTVGDSYITQYNHCSSEKLEGCYPQETNYASYEKCGEWIKVVEFD